MVLPRAGHTMTMIDNTRLIILGGISSTDYFSSAIWEYDTSSNVWKEKRKNGAGAVPTGW